MGSGTNCYGKSSNINLEYAKIFSGDQNVKENNFITWNRYFRF